MNKWVQQLKVGDEVFVSRGGWGRYYDKGEVVRLTKTQIIIKQSGYESKWRRVDGRSLSGTTYSRQYLFESTPELKEEIEAQLLKNKVKQLINNFKMPNDKVSLDQIIGILKEFQRPENKG
jgi:hypothetical protein